MNTLLNALLGLALATVGGSPLICAVRIKTPPLIRDQNGVSAPRLAMAPTAGTWKYKSTDVIPGGTYLSTFSIAIKDDGTVWTVTTAWNFPDGPVTDVSTLEKDTLVLRKELLKHFPKPGRPWVPVTMKLDFSGNKVTGGTTTANGQRKPVAVDLEGPVFADAAASDVTIGCLPLAGAYSTTFRNWDVDKLKRRLLRLKVVGMERVTVPAGTFDSYKVELISADGLYQHTVWIAKDSRTPVKAQEVEVLGKGDKKVTSSTTTELVP
ncbi:MAG TPA: hypothetical protein VH724_01980 [Candidatus Angelobacter sp.]|nr:hypothetical protein [Candidatus Angelobacter sp.]